MNVGQPVVTSLEFESQPLVVDAETVQHCGVKVVNVNGIGDDVVAEIVRLTM